MDEEAVANFMRQAHEFWIDPEITRRREAGTLPNDFKIYHCLIKLPQDQPPIIAFNDEISWSATAKRTDDQPLTAGEPIYLHEIVSIKSVEAPEVDGKRVAFIFLYTNGLYSQCIFDFSPNSAELIPEDAHEWRFGELIAHHLQSLMTERAIDVYDSVEEELHKIGLWAAPALLPYPISKMAKGS